MVSDRIKLKLLQNTGEIEDVEIRSVLGEGHRIRADGDPLAIFVLHFKQKLKGIARLPVPALQQHCAGNLHRDGRKRLGSIAVDKRNRHEIIRRDHCILCCFALRSKSAARFKLGDCDLHSLVDALDAEQHIGLDGNGDAAVFIGNDLTLGGFDGISGIEPAELNFKVEVDIVGDLIALTIGMLDRLADHKTSFDAVEGLEGVDGGLCLCNDKGYR